MVLHGLLVVEDVPGAGLLSVARPQQGVGLGLGDDGGRDHGGAHVHVQLGPHQQSNGRTEPRVCLQNLQTQILLFSINYYVKRIFSKLQQPQIGKIELELANCDSFQLPGAAASQ